MEANITQGEAYDLERSAVLERYGLLVLRFSNLEVEQEFDGVCTLINKTIQSRMNLNPDAE